MHTNIISFPKAHANRAAAVVAKVQDNVVKLNEWKARAKCRRTSFGVFFTTDVLRFSNCAA